MSSFIFIFQHPHYVSLRERERERERRGRQGVKKRKMEGEERVRGMYREKGREIIHINHFED